MTQRINSGLPDREQTSLRIQRARDATGLLRDAVREGRIIDFRARDPLIVAVHDALDLAEQLREAHARVTLERDASRESVTLAHEQLQELDDLQAAQAVKLDHADAEIARLQQAISVQGLTGDALVSLAIAHREDSEKVDAYEAEREQAVAAQASLRTALRQRTSYWRGQAGISSFRNVSKALRECASEIESLLAESGVKAIIERAKADVDPAAVRRLADELASQGEQTEGPSLLAESRQESA